MDLPFFLELDPEEVVFHGVAYLEYFNLYPNLRFEPTLRLLMELENVDVQGSEEDSEGWRVAVRFCDIDFLLDSHFHGTSTSFCIVQAITDVQRMLAFLGCFMPMIRDDWRLPSAVGKKKRGWLRRLLDSD